MNLTINVIDKNLNALIADQIIIDPDPSNSFNFTGLSTSSFSALITDGSSPLVAVEINGYTTYEQVFDVYSEDLTITILMAPLVTDISDSEYLKPYPYLSYINDPCSYDVSYYLTSNSLGSAKWYFNNKFISEGSKGKFDTFSEGNYQLKVRQRTFNTESLLAWDRQFATVFTGNTTIYDVDSISSYLENDLTTNLIVNEHRPDVSFDLSGSKQDDGCFTINQEVIITPSVTLNVPTNSSETITWEITDPNDVVLLETVGSLTDTVAIQLDELGVYKINAKVNDACGIYDYDLEIVICNSIVITQTDCSSFLIQNKGNTDTTLEIQDIQGNEVLAEMTLESFKETLVTFDQVGFYNAIIGENNYLINNYCEIEDCFSSYIESILCEPVDRCNPCPDESNLNQMMLFQYTYFNKLHKEFTFNNFYTGLDQSKIDQITTIEQLATKIMTFCQRMGCFSSDTFKPAGEETYDWAGKGSNFDKTCSCSPVQTLNYYQTGPSTGCKSCGS